MRGFGAKGDGGRLAAARVPRSSKALQKSPIHSRRDCHILLHRWRHCLLWVAENDLDNRIPAGHAAFLTSSSYTKFGYSSKSAADMTIAQSAIAEDRLAFDAIDGSTRRSLSFRTDISGLRAIAVLAVMGHHFGMTGLDGGFIGVDIFFVISGFLMTRIILEQWSAGRFSITGFYAARARRIVPALAMLVATLLFAGYFFLLPIEYRALGKQSVASLSFLSNVLFWREGGYFDAGSHEKWLLHTWSLSVEWQFYLLFPLLLAMLLRFKSARYLSPVILAAFAASLALSAAATFWKPAASFYLLPTRFWELLAGAIVQMHASKIAVPARHLAALGLALIITSAALFHRDMYFPGFWAVIPVAGTMAVIASGVQSWLLNNRVFQYFGEISYSLYLWHWPMVVGATLLGIPFTAWTVAVLFIASVTLASISWSFVEKPYRKGGSTRSSVTLLSAGLGTMAVATSVWVLAGLPSRLPESVVNADAESLNSSPRAEECVVASLDDKAGLRECGLGTATAPRTVALWGDSHALSALGALNAALLQTRRSGAAYLASGCPPLEGIGIYLNGRETHCRRFNDAVRTRLVSDSEIRDIFLVSRWSAYLYGLDIGAGKLIQHIDLLGFHGSPPKPGMAARENDFLAAMVNSMCTLTAAGKDVYVFAPVPELGRNVPKVVAQNRLWNVEVDVTLPRSAYQQRHAKVLRALAEAQRQCGVRILDPLPYLCDASKCFGVKDGRPMYYDGDHLSEFGNRSLTPLFRNALDGSPVPLPENAPR